MKRFFVIALLFVISFIWMPAAYATYVVHDSISYIHDTVKAVQDELYQQLDLDTAAEALAVGQDTLDTCRDTLKTARETYDTAVNIYNTAVQVKNYIGDPARLVAYINSRFWHDQEIAAALKITQDAMELADGKVSNAAQIEFLLSIPLAIALRITTLLIRDSKRIKFGLSIVVAFIKLTILKTPTKNTPSQKEL